MHRVLLIGDSIRMHYEPYVRRLLDGRAEISGPRENCESSRETRASLAGWLDAFSPDIIHVNCGLHDIRIDPGAASVRVPLPEYTRNIKTILSDAQRHASRVIFATSTPIDEALHRTTKESRRFEADLSAYNHAAVEVASAAGVEIDDLCSRVAEYGPRSLWIHDGVHFTEEGYMLIARWVADCLSAHLPEGAETPNQAMERTPDRCTR